ncbi:MAG: hormogonium polysaccharide biosynthesis glycosyltransferase HpsE, partial [Phormidesmis sp.]
MLKSTPLSSSRAAGSLATHPAQVITQAITQAATQAVSEQRLTNTAAPSVLDLTVAIPTYNGEQRLAMVLDRLRSQIQLDAIRWEIIVCDNGSTDGTADLVRRYQAKWPSEYPLHYRFAAEQGAAFARQYAVESAAGNLIAFLDDDNLPASDWVAQAYRFAQSHPQAGAFGSQIHGQFETELPPELQEIRCFLAIIERGQQPHLYEPAKKILPPAAGLVVQKEAWMSAVPPRLFLNNKGKEAGLASEDLEAILHIQKSGWEIWYNPDMVVHHDIPDGRLRKNYLITLFRCVGLSRFHVRLLGIESWKHPFVIPAYVANDIRKLALHRVRHGRSHQLSTTESCHRALLKSTVASPTFLLKKVVADAVQTFVDSRHCDRKQWLAQITQAFEQERFALYQQPVITVRSLATESLNSSVTDPAFNQKELLLRLYSNQNEYILPSSFLPTAERYGLMRTIDRWVIRHLFDRVSQSRQSLE